MTKVHSELNIQARTCGSCTLCCFTHKVQPREGESFQKDEATWCQYCTQGQGCSVYATRPTACQEFLCGWLVGLGTIEDRPDKTHVVMHRFRLGERTFMVKMVESAPGAIQASGVQSVIQDRIRKKDLVALHYLDTKIELWAHRDVGVPLRIQIECMDMNIPIKRVE